MSKEEEGDDGGLESREITDLDRMLTTDVVRAAYRMMSCSDCPVVTAACTDFGPVADQIARGEPPKAIIAAGAAMVPMHLFDKARHLFTQLQKDVGDLIYDDIENSSGEPSSKGERFVVLSEEGTEQDRPNQQAPADKSKIH